MIALTLSRGSIALPFIVLWMSLGSGVQAQSLQSLFESGNRAYFEGDYATAVSHYAQLVDLGVHDPDVYFNLGTAYAQQGTYGRASLAFERSLRLESGRGAAATAVARARQALAERHATRGARTVDAAVPRVIPPPLEAWAETFSERTLAMTLLLANALLFLVLFALTWIRREVLRIGLMIVAALSGLLCLVAGPALALRTDGFGEGQRALVVAEEASLREGPDARAGVRGSALEGERGRILMRDGDYLRVRLANGLEGWMAHQDIEPVIPPTRTGSQH